MESAKDRFESAMRRAGIDVPADLYQGTFAVYQELIAMAALMRTPREAESEPAGQYRIDSILPGGAGR